VAVAGVSLPSSECGPAAESVEDDFLSSARLGKSQLTLYDINCITSTLCVLEDGSTEYRTSTEYRHQFNAVDVQFVSVYCCLVGPGSSSHISVVKVSG